MKKILQKIMILIFLFIFKAYAVEAQLPTNVLVGYHENWNTLKLTQIHTNYNVICLAFGVAVNSPAVGYDIRYAIPSGYTGSAAQKKIDFIADIDALHSAGKVVLLSIGGATAPIMLANTQQRDVFVNSINAIMADYSYKIDGIDLDLESSSMAFGSTWTITSPAAEQTNMINAIKTIMANYQTIKGKKMLLTAAPEAIYLMGGLSTWQIANTNGGTFLPILDGLRNELDLLQMQLYNAGGSSAGVYAWNNALYYDNGTSDFALAMNESVIKGFTCVSGKGIFVGIPASKLSFGFPATSLSASTGYVTPANICAAAKYFKGEITKPSSNTYTMTAAYPTLKGLMTWSVDEDYTNVNGAWYFATNYTCAFPSTTTEVATISSEASGLVIFPNPSAYNATIEINLKNTSHVNLTIKDITGRDIYTFDTAAELSIGKHTFLSPTDLSPGMYYVQMISNNAKTSTIMIRIN